MTDSTYSAIIAGAALLKLATVIVAALLPSCSLLPAPCSLPQSWSLNITLFHRSF